MNPVQTGIAVALALVVIGIFFVFPGLSPLGQTPGTSMATTTVDMNTQSTNQDTTTTTMTQNPTDLQTIDEVVGTGAEAKAGETVTVKYTGMLTDGTVFDASDKHPDADGGFTFPLGAGMVIKGWDQGVVGMKVGGKRQLVIPASLGYGANGYPPVIPGNATLVFEVELLKVH